MGAATAEAMEDAASLADAATLALAAEAAVAEDIRPAVSPSPPQPMGTQGRVVVGTHGRVVVGTHGRVVVLQLTLPSASSAATPGAHARRHSSKSSTVTRRQPRRQRASMPRVRTSTALTN